jgi:hypothetical protein
MLQHYSQKLFFLLSEDALHTGFSCEEIVSSMRKAMFEIPISNASYMEGVRDRARMQCLGEVDISTFSRFLDSLVQLQLARWVTQEWVQQRISIQWTVKTGLDWIARKSSVETQSR